MRIGVATVLFDDEWQVESRNLDARIRLMRAILRAADRHRTALLVLPAGFFVVYREKDRDDIVRRARRSLLGARTAVLWGVDVHMAGAISKAGHRKRDPFFRSICTSATQAVHSCSKTSGSLRTARRRP